MRAIVTDIGNDPVLAEDARAFGAVYMPKPEDEDALLEAARNILHEQTPRVSTSVPRRWARREAAQGITGKLGECDMTVLDVSYGGLRLEVTNATEQVALRPAKMAVPSAGLAFITAPVWARHFGASACWWCGVELKESGHPAAVEWRRFVDSC